ncbi:MULTISPECIES: sugar phosphate isomerase/epimerase family protein [Peribacillus]|uniref:Sugar phosphate isomerase/epimerase n=2 Tax=Peribacillus simplex TaxID=1478 RepID=A0A9X8WK51_9BACI|nr:MULTISPECIES: sugar phosphate isomerase/epimerase family protein [Peribacillus]WHY57657.1 sugar phosphate isomerase/epimerase family protein [Peribacillus simplex]SIQ99471.1 Sugar phosphate isomerase/epimerase [Peribacillus simplex]
MGLLKEGSRKIGETMSENLHNSMKVGIVHFMAYPETMGGDGPTVETIKKIVQDDFFSGIEITSINNPEERKEATQILQSGGMTVGFGAQPILLRNKGNLNSFDEAERRRAIDLVKVGIDQAYEVNAAKLGFLSGAKPDTQQDVALQLLTNSIKELCDYAKSKGDLVLSLETFDDETDKKCLIGSNKLAVEVAKEVRKVDPTFGLMLDLSHLPMQRETSSDALTVARDYINHAHIGNCYIKDTSDPAYGDQHPRFGYPGSEVDVSELAEYLRSLLEIGYIGEGIKNIVAFEVKPVGTESSDIVIAQSKRTLIDAWSLLHSKKGRLVG